MDLTDDFFGPWLLSIVLFLVAVIAFSILISNAETAGAKVAFFVLFIVTLIALIIIFSIVGFTRLGKTGANIEEDTGKLNAEIKRMTNRINRLMEQMKSTCIVPLNYSNQHTKPLTPEDIRDLQGKQADLADTISRILKYADYCLRVFNEDFNSRTKLYGGKEAIDAIGASIKRYRRAVEVDINHLLSTCLGIINAEYLSPPEYITLFRKAHSVKNACTGCRAAGGECNGCMVLSELKDVSFGNQEPRSQGKQKGGEP